MFLICYTGASLIQAYKKITYIYNKIYLHQKRKAVKTANAYKFKVAINKFAACLTMKTHL